MGTESSYRVRANVSKKIEEDILNFLRNSADGDASDIWGKNFSQPSKWWAEDVVKALSKAFPNVIFMWEETVENGSYERGYWSNGSYLSEENIFPKLRIPSDNQFASGVARYRNKQRRLQRLAQKTRERKEAEEKRQARITQLRNELSSLENRNTG